MAHRRIGRKSVCTFQGNLEKGKGNWRRNVKVSSGRLERCSL